MTHNVQKKKPVYQHGDKITLNSRFNPDVASALKHSRSLFPQGQYKSFCKWLGKAVDGKVSQTYKVLETGRLESGYGLHQMWAEARSGLVYGIYRDYDIQNCHPSILAQRLNQVGRPCPLLDDYVANVSTWRAKQKGAKTLVLSFLNGGGIPKNETVLPFFKHLKDELKDNMEHLISLEPTLAQRIKEAKPRGRHKVFRSCCSLITQTLECKVLLSFFDFCQTNNIEVGALIHDGCLLGAEPKGCEQHIKMQTGFEVKIVEKPVPAIDLSKLGHDIIGSDIEDDAEGAEIFLEYYRNRFIKCGEDFYVRNSAFWIKGLDPLGRMISDLALTKAGKPYSRNLRGLNNIIGMIKTQALDHGKWLFELNDQCIDLIFYKDKVWNMKARRFEAFGDRSSTCYIDRPAPIERFKEYDEQGWSHPDVQKILDKIFCAFESREGTDYFLKCLARAIGGHIYDKTYFLMTGFRNSGKGTIQELVMTTYKDYVTTANPPIASDMASGDSATDYRWLLTSGADRARVCFTNESRDTGKTPKLAGNLIKAIVSGGDILQARRMRENEVNVRPNCLFFMNFNKIPIANPADALETARILHTPFKFDNSLVGVKGVKKGDNNVKQWIRDTDWVQDAFAWMVFQMAGDTPAGDLPIPSEFRDKTTEVKTGNSNDPFFIFKTSCQLDEGSYEPKSTVRELFSKCGMSDIALTKWLKTQGVVPSQSTITEEVNGHMVSSTVKTYKGLKIISAEMDD